MDAGFIQSIAGIFKDYPGYLCMLAIIYWLIRLVMGLQETMKDFLKISSGEVERTTRITTLLEILVSDKRGGTQ
jgi:hypothetical protein